MLKSNHSADEIRDLLSEYGHLKDLDHPNVVKMLGVCMGGGGGGRGGRRRLSCEGGPLCLVMEFAEFGSLRSYLRAKRGVFETSSSMGGSASTSAATASCLFHRSVSQDSEGSAGVSVASARPQQLYLSLATPTSTDILKFAYQIAKGMEYLAAKSLCHRYVLEILLKSQYTELRNSCFENDVVFNCSRSPETSPPETYFFSTSTSAR